MSERLTLALALLAGLLSLINPPPASAQEAYEPRTEYVRVTFYVLRGHMASGIWTHLGAAACSYGYPMGSVLEMPDGFEVTCLDRGYLGRSTGWVDIWAPSRAWGWSQITGEYGDYTWVTVKRWGWE